MKVGEYEVQDMPKGEVTGRLEDWRLDTTTYGATYAVLWGHIYDDVRCRFFPGESFRSSALVGSNFENLKEGDYVRTLNSCYLLGKPRGNVWPLGTTPTP